MRVVLQRVSHARVRAGGVVIGEIGVGLLAFTGVAHADTDDDVAYLVDKVVNLRVFPDGEGRFDRSLHDVAGSVLVVSQFTLFAETRKGRRPSFAAAAPPEVARPLIERFAQRLRDAGITVETGHFGAAMEVDSVNDGPVTILIDSGDRRSSRRALG